MRARFWGTRGSFVAPGSAFQRFGGNTICVELVSGSARIVCDLGTGCVQLGNALMAESAKGGSKRFLVLLSNTQIDHIQGLPFFVPAIVPGWDITIVGPANAGRDIEGVLDSALNPNYSPLFGIENLAAKLSLRTGVEGDYEWDGIVIKTRELPHTSGKALGFRFEKDGASIAYLSDVEYPGDVPPPAAIELARDADVLVHDATGESSQAARGPGRGSQPTDAIAVARQAHAKKLLLFHHDPDMTDVHMDVFLDRIRRVNPDLDIDAAREGDVVELGRG
ncbi:MAG TPA: MBL fold metallo-hydrolase [bacterium]|nr:MBL fold metallo-hydrolase [bacterium]